MILEYTEVTPMHRMRNSETVREVFKSTLTDLGPELTGFKYQTIASSSLAAHFKPSLGDISPVVTLATIVGMIYRLYI